MADVLHSWLLLTGLVLGGASAAGGLAAAVVGARTATRIAVATGAASLLATGASAVLHRYAGHGPGSVAPYPLGRFGAEHPAFWIAALLAVAGLVAARVAATRSTDRR